MAFDPSLSSLLRSVDAERWLENLAGLSGVAEEDAPPVTASSDTASKDDLAGQGFAVLANAHATKSCARLVEAISHIVGAGLPAVFVYAFEPLWTLGERLRARISTWLGHPYVLMNDVWAWSIPADGSGGWSPHRGFGERLDRRAPEIVNVWLALSDATVERSCMHFVKLDDDADYPDHLDRATPPSEHARAVPIAAGAALAWNANVLHWGGRCEPHAAGPRVSCSFSLVRGTRAETLSVVEAGAMDFTARLDAVAQQIATYGQGQHDVSPDVLEWARATYALRRQIERWR